VPVISSEAGRVWARTECGISGAPNILTIKVPTEFEERDGVPVSVVSHFGPGMDAVATADPRELAFKRALRRGSGSNPGPVFRS